MDSNIGRRTLLDQLINNDESPSILINKLQANENEIDDAEVILTRSHIVNMIRKCLNNDISSGELEDWANAVEMRDGVEYENGFEKQIAGSLFELSTPEINHPLTKEYLMEHLTHLLSNNETQK